MVFETFDGSRASSTVSPWVDRATGPEDTRAFIEETIATEGREYAYGIYADDGFVVRSGCTPTRSTGAR